MIFATRHSPPSVRASLDLTTRHSAGMILLMSVIVIGTSLLIIGLAAASMGQTEVFLAQDADWEQRVRYTTVACGEEALYRLKKDPTYTGGTVSVEGNDCTLTVTGGGSSRTIDATTTISGYTKSIRLGASRRANA